MKGIKDQIKVPIPGLEKAITPGPGHMILMQGAPGTGKSFLGLWWAVHMDTPALYLSIDSDLSTQAARTTSMLTGVPYNAVMENAGEWTNFLRTLDRKLPMMVDAPVKSGDIDGLVQAFEEFYSHKPSLVVVDNLKDVVLSRTFEGYMDAVQDIMRVAKKHRIVILLLHHVNRGSGAGTGKRAPELDSGKFGGEDDAPFVLSLWEAWDEYVGKVLNIRVNKNRFGPKDFDVSLKLNFEKYQIGAA